MAVTKVGRVVLTVTDLDEAVRHYTETMGLSVTTRRAGEAYLRLPGDQDHHNLVLQQSDRASLASFGLKMSDPGDLEELELVAGRAGADVRRVSAGEHPGLGEAVVFRLPSEHEVWAYHDIEHIGWAGGMENPDPVPEDATAGTVHAQRIDHVAICAPDVGDLATFLTEVLDFDSSEILIGPDGRPGATWMYCTNTMHDIAVVPGPGAGLHHVSFAADSRAAVINGIDTLRHRGVPTMDFGLTRHGIAGVTTTYFHDPSGIRNELFFGPYPTPGVPGQVPPVEWEMAEFARGAFYYENELDMAFMTEIT